MPLPKTYKAMKTFLKTQTLPKYLLSILVLAFALCYGCNSSPSASDSDGNAALRNSAGMTLVRGTVATVSSKEIIIKTKDSTQTIMLADSLQYLPGLRAA
jgi:hypothetical protein